MSTSWKESNVGRIFNPSVMRFAMDGLEIRPTENERPWLGSMVTLLAILSFVGLLASFAAAQDQNGRQGTADPVTEAVGDAVPTADEQFVIDLATALRLAESQNPQIALAREKVTEAVAQHQQARALWLPTLTAGTNYHLHSGVLQSADGVIRQVNAQSVYVGSGAGAIGSGTVAVPGVRIFGHTGDLYYLPLAARQTAAARAFDSHAVNNLTLMDVADRYLTLVEAEARREALQASLFETGEIARILGVFARAGQGRDADYRRGRSEFLLMKLQEQQAEEDAAVAAAELSRLLHLDPSIRLVTPAGPIELLQLVDESQDLELLVNEALSHRPEVASRSAEIGAAEYRLRDEQRRPWLPMISLGFSGGAFGGGSNRQDLGVPSFYMGTAGRTDFDVFAVWTSQNLRLGNRALRGMRGAEVEQTVMLRALTLAQIRREVTLHQAQSQARRRQVDVSWTQLQAAERGAEEEFRRTRGGDALPIEALNSATRLSESRRQLLDTIIDYNRAELKLFVSLGQTPSDSNPALTGASSAEQTLSTPPSPSP